MRIWTEKIRGLYQDELILSTVKVDGAYEVALLHSDGAEIELETFDDVDNALAFHDMLRLRCWKEVKESYPFMRDTPFESVVQEVYCNESMGA